jgi:hypothetical protein
VTPNTRSKLRSRALPSHPYRLPPPRRSLAPRAPWYRIAWAALRGVFGKLRRAQRSRAEAKRFPGVRPSIRRALMPTLGMMEDIVTAFDTMTAKIDRVAKRQEDEP